MAHHKDMPNSCCVKYQVILTGYGRSVVVISKYLVLVIPANIDRIRSLDLLLFLPRSAFLLSDPGLGWSLGP